MTMQQLNNKTYYHEYVMRCEDMIMHNNEQQYEAFHGISTTFLPFPTKNLD